MKNLIIWLVLILAKLSRSFRYKLLSSFVRLREILSEESRETKEMLNIYFMYSTMGKVSKKDLSRANKQFADILKTAGLGAFLVLPFAPITIPFIVKLASAFGLNVLPSGAEKYYKKFVKPKDPTK